LEFLVVVSDGPAGLRIKPRDNDVNTYYATAFPGTALASTWNTELINSVGKP
jgi:beta-glucosidase